MSSLEHFAPSFRFWVEVSEYIFPPPSGSRWRSVSTFFPLLPVLGGGQWVHFAPSFRFWVEVSENIVYSTCELGYNRVGRNVVRKSVTRHPASSLVCSIAKSCSIISKEYYCMSANHTKEDLYSTWEKAKVVAASRGSELLQYIAAAIFHQDDLKNIGWFAPRTRIGCNNDLSLLFCKNPSSMLYVMFCMHLKIQTIKGSLDCPFG